MCSSELPRIDSHGVLFGTLCMSLFTSTMSGLPYYICVCVCVCVCACIIYSICTGALLCIVLKLGHFCKWMTNTWKILECGVGEGWRKSVGPIVCELKYVLDSGSREHTSHIKREG